MSRNPTAEDRKRYPHLTQRDWPPVELVPTTDMNVHEADELRLYWRDQQQEAEQAAQDTVRSAPFQRWWEGQLEAVEHRQDVVIARPERQQDTSSFQLPSHRENELDQLALNRERGRIDAHQAYEKDLYHRALQQPFRSKAEREFLNAAQAQSWSAYLQAQDIVVAERMARLRDKDQEDRVAALERDIRKNEREHERRQNRELIRQAKELRKHRQEELAEERDLPVPGPNGDPYHQQDLEEARERVLADYDDGNRAQQQIRQQEADRRFLEELERDRDR